DLSKSSGGLTAITDYLPKEALVVLDEPLAIAEEARRLEEQVAGNPYFMTWDDAEAHLSAFRRLSVAQIGYDRREDTPRHSAPMRSMTWEGHAEGFWQQLERWGVEDYRVVLVC